MDVNAVMQAINTVGFPIVMCLILMYMVYKQGEDHKEEMNKVQDSLNNNTLAIQHLTDMLGKDTKGE